MSNTNENTTDSYIEISSLEVLQQGLKTVTEVLVLTDLSYLKTECRGMASRLSDIIKSLTQESLPLETK